MSSLLDFDWKEELGIEVDNFEGLFDKTVPIYLLGNSLIKKDIWHTIDDLALKTHEHQKVLTLNFTFIYPSWFKVLAKLYILTRTNLKLSVAYLKDDISHFKKFSKFIKNYHLVSIKQINDLLFDEFAYWLNLTGISKRTISSHYTSLQNFFDTCRIEGWLDVNTYWFKSRKTIATANNNDIEYLPEEIWNQLEEHLHYFPEPMPRKILIIRTLGLRIGELLNLPLDCLRKRGEQWHLRIKETEKFEIRGDELPIPVELVAIIKEQQEYIRHHFGNSYNKLFCSNCGGKNFQFVPINRVMNLLTFNCWLNRLSKKYNICRKNGRLWHFKSHQFRKTVATIMANAGIRDLIIQKYLRHRNPDMQNHYKHLLKEVIGKEYEELVKEKKYVDITGKVVATYKPQDAISEYMRRRMHQITTQVGECHRPNLKQPCPTVNACGRCEHWRNSVNDLPFLKQDLERLKKEEEIADELGLIRNQKELQKDIDYFQVRIMGLEDTIKND